MKRFLAILAATGLLLATQGCSGPRMGPQTYGAAFVPPTGQPSYYDAGVAAAGPGCGCR